MAKYSNVLPDGAYDLLFKECEARRKVEERVVDTFSMRGFSEVITPSLEFYDVFCGAASVMENETMYKIIDGRGRILVLRPDNTPPIARIAATKLKGFTPPLRLYYNQNVFRISPLMTGRYDEVAQCGAELIGACGSKADIEMIVLAIAALKSVLGDDFRFELGHAGFYKALIESLPLDEQEKEKIRSLIASKSYASLQSILEPYAPDYAACRALIELPRLFGGQEVLDRALRFAPNPAAAEPILYLKSLYASLKDLGLEGHAVIDLGLVHQIEYYTGVIFLGYSHGMGVPVLSGGRYDRLLSNFGMDLPATGFAVNIDAIAQAYAQGLSISLAQVLIFAESRFISQAFSYMDALIAQGTICEMSVFDTLEQTQDYARARGIGRIDIVGDCVQTQRLKPDAEGGKA